MAKRVPRALLAGVILLAIVLVLSGRWTDVWLWAYGAGWTVTILGMMLVMDDDLLKERMHPPEPGADRLPLRAIRLLALVHIIVGALDLGHWQLALVPPILRGLGLAATLAACALIGAAMRANRFFSPVVRVQRERGHHVVTTGPYARIRHPGYAGMILAIPLSALTLGSWLGVALALGYAALILRRVKFEDGFLQENLQGYRDYASVVRYRLVPGAW